MDTMRFITCVLRNAARIRGYKLGHDGSDGYSDCIGLLVGALALDGVAWPGINGTNYTARYLVDDLRRDATLKMGDLVFKAQQPGEPGYALPQRYADSPDRLDYYRVGVVLQASPVRIVHCTSGGIRLDEERGDWQYSAWLRLVREKEPQAYAAIVRAETGSTVNLHSGPGLQYEILRQVPIGSRAQVLEETDADWARIDYQGKEGYMMRAFLARELPAQDVLLEQLVLLRQQVDAILQAARTADRALDELAQTI